MRTLLPLAACVLILISGCGRKGPPLAPRSLPPVSVTDLNVRLESRTAVLVWSVPTSPDSEAPDAYRIYRARSGPESCEGCPLMFQKIGVIHLSQADRPARGLWTLTWRDEIEVGFRYVYKVTSLRGRDRMADSNLVVIQP